MQIISAVVPEPWKKSYDTDQAGCLSGQVVVEIRIRLQYPGIRLADELPRRGVPNPGSGWTTVRIR